MVYSGITVVTSLAVDCGAIKYDGMFNKVSFTQGGQLIKYYCIMGRRKIKNTNYNSETQGIFSPFPCFTGEKSLF